MLATIPVLITVEYKIPNVSDLNKKADYETKKSEIENNILVLLIIRRSKVIHWIQKQNKKS